METSGRYTIYGKIASGGMASVYFGRQRGGEGFTRTVAVKRLHPHLAENPAFRATMIDEARMAARIHHPNVVPTLDVVSDEGDLLVVMEYVRGEALSRLLSLEEDDGQREVPMPIAVAIAVDALRGLHAAHLATSEAGAPLGIVHRDVSPQNLMVGTDGLTRVIDFGVAKAAGRLQITREGTIKGKRPYMAPEQVSGAPVDRSADVYAMGVVLWEMLAGRRLFEGDNDAALVARVLIGAREAPSAYASHVPVKVDALVLRALALDPAERFSSALDMARALVELVSPALATDVGRWVEVEAKVALAERSARVAEIESGARSSVTAARAEVSDEIPTAPLGSQLSGFPSERPRIPTLRRQATSWGIAGALAAAMLVVAASVPRTRPIAHGEQAAVAPSPPTRETSVIAAALPEPIAEEHVAPAPPRSAPETEAAALQSPRARVSSSARPTSSALPVRTRPPAGKSEAACSIATDYDKDGQPHFRTVCK